METINIKINNKEYSLIYCLTEEEKEEGYEVVGWLTAEEVFERIKKLEEENEKSN